MRDIYFFVLFVALVNERGEWRASGRVEDRQVRCLT